MKFVALLMLTVTAVAFAQQRQLLLKLEIDYQQSMLPGRKPHFPPITEWKDLRILENRQMPADPDKIDDRALITFLNTGANIPMEVRKWALASHFGTDRIIGENDVFPVGVEVLPSKPTGDPTFPKAGPHGSPPTAAQAEKIAALGASVGLLVRSSEVLGPAGNAQIYAKHFGRLLNLCPSTPEYDSRIIDKSGTGFLVSPKHIITAGHCVKIVGEEPQIIFGYIEEAVAASEKKYPGSDWLFFGKSVEIRTLKLVALSDPDVTPDKGDWAIYEIEGTPSARKPLEFNDGTPITSKDQNLVMIGHPCGLALRTTIRERSNLRMRGIFGPISMRLWATRALLFSTRPLGRWKVFSSKEERIFNL